MTNTNKTKSKAESDKVKKVVAQFYNLGYAVHYYPRLKKVSISGMPAIPQKEAVSKMNIIIEQIKTNNRITTVNL